MNMLNDSFRFTPHITLEFKIEEKDFFIAGESASRVKKDIATVRYKAGYH